VKDPISCEVVRDALLVAEPEELRGEGRGEVVDHLRTCAQCRADAGRIMAGSRALDAWLGKPGRAPTLAQLAGRVPGDPGSARRGSWRRARPAVAWIALSAAAAAVALLVRPPVRPRHSGNVVEVPRKEEPLPLVQDAGGRSFAVLETEDPDITVLWFF